jgi:hypothetical protein
MTRVILLAGVALSLAACGHRDNLKPQAAKLLAPAVAAPSALLVAPTPQKGLDWFMTTQGDQAKLAYGPANADASMMLTCAKGSGKLAVTRVAPADQAGDPPILGLASGTAKGRWLATAQPAPAQAGAVQLSVAATTTDPAMDAFQRNGWLTPIGPDGKPAGPGMAPHSGGEAAVKHFFVFCG